jgi:hypothetical protein
MATDRTTATERSLLIIADIGGYTDYMRTHRMSLAHAEVNTSRMLERIVDAAPDFDLVEIEGDAAFLSRPADRLAGATPVAATLDVAAAMHRAFHLERRYVATNLCPCQGCAEVGNLKLKFVAHIGEVATQRIRQQVKLVGIDVILVHRLLKNSVELPEYVLLTEELRRLGDGLPPSGQELTADLEGIGPTRTFVLDVADLPDASTAPLPDPPLLSRLGRTISLAGTGLPYMLGLRRGRDGRR